MANLNQMTIGFIGTGWVGRSYAKDFISRRFNVISYSLEPDYLQNKERIKDCDIVVIAVPTPADENGANYDVLKSAVDLVGSGKIAVIKSTILPGTTDMLQNGSPEKIIIHSPEFLSMATADYDATHPNRNIWGLPNRSAEHLKALDILKDIFPRAAYTVECSATEAEIIKFSHNIGGYLKIVFHNLLYDICLRFDGDWEKIKMSMAADPNNLLSYLNPVHNEGRGAGGPCFIKDFLAFKSFYKSMSDELGTNFLSAIEEKNLSLLVNSNKDIGILQKIYGDEKVATFQKIQADSQKDH